MVRKELRPDGAATYRIYVQGILDERWSDRMGGLTIAIIDQESEAPVTVLSGRLLDQSALLGVLNTLHDMRLPLLSVKCDDCDNDLLPKKGG
ncbi:MAG TPA: hypothetical protein P5526_11505 [Anaerolineae bacterium]|nr:hypothetical protein [Anaerolineae bacterium]MCB0223616.1 hypothetical protein [Anaerolineae bacterium]HRV92780.1 hypothetical protein [Anaerolineae bacterium]